MAHNKAGRLLNFDELAISFKDETTDRDLVTDWYVVVVAAALAPVRSFIKETRASISVDFKSLSNTDVLTRMLSDLQNINREVKGFEDHFAFPEGACREFQLKLLVAATAKLVPDLVAEAVAMVHDGIQLLITELSELMTKRASDMDFEGIMNPGTFDPLDLYKVTQTESCRLLNRRFRQYAEVELVPGKVECALKSIAPASFGDDWTTFKKSMAAAGLAVRTKAFKRRLMLFPCLRANQL